MKLLLLDQYSEPGGAQQALLELLPAIRNRGWSALVGLPGSGELFNLIGNLGFPVERIDCGPYHSSRKTAADLRRFLSSTPRLARQIRRLARRMDADLVYVNGPRLLPAAALAGLNCPVLFHAHSYLPRGMTRTAAGLALRHLDARVVANCEFVAAQWNSFVRPQQVSIVHNGVAGPAGPRPRRFRRHPSIGCIGRISPEKGQREFVAAAARIRESLPQCRFRIYGKTMFGNPETERYSADVRAAACGWQVEFPGWMQDVYAAFSELDLLLVPSTGQEATTRVILEAFAAGVPVIAFGSGGIPEVINDGVNGILVNTVQEMAQQAVDLLTGDPNRRLAISQAARHEWQLRFTLERFHDRLLRAFETPACPAPPPLCALPESPPQTHAAGSSSGQ